MAGLIKEGKKTIDEEAPPELKDAALIAAAQRVEHYEIAGYGCVRTYASLLGDDDAADLLQTTLDEEAATDKKLNGRIGEAQLEGGSGFPPETRKQHHKKYELNRTPSQRELERGQRKAEEGLRRPDVTMT